MLHNRSDIFDVVKQISPTKTRQMAIFIKIQEAFYPKDLLIVDAGNDLKRLVLDAIRKRPGSDHSDSCSRGLLENVIYNPPGRSVRTVSH